MLPLPPDHNLRLREPRQEAAPHLLERIAWQRQLHVADARAAARPAAARPAAARPVVTRPAVPAAATAATTAPVARLPCWLRRAARVDGERGELDAHVVAHKLVVAPHLVVEHLADLDDVDGLEGEAAQHDEPRARHDDAAVAVRLVEDQPRLRVRVGHLRLDRRAHRLGRHADGAAALLERALHLALGPPVLTAQRVDARERHRDEHRDEAQRRKRAVDAKRRCARADPTRWQGRCVDTERAATVAVVGRHGPAIDPKRLGGCELGREALRPHPKQHVRRSQLDVLFVGIRQQSRVQPEVPDVPHEEVAPVVGVADLMEPSDNGSDEWPTARRLRVSR